MQVVPASVDLIELLPAVAAPTHQSDAVLLGELPPGPAETWRARGLAYLSAGRAFIRERHQAGAAGLSTARLHSELLDRVVRPGFLEIFGPSGLAAQVCLVAVGGFGRREQAPFSDVDLLLLRGPRAKEDALAPLARAFTTQLWDLRLQVGWALRTPSECARAALDDQTVRTALLDARFVCGDEALFTRLTHEVVPELLRRHVDSFVSDKVEEVRLRREKFGHSVYLLEPNLKQGEGGLRDLESALWIAQMRFGTRRLQGLEQASILRAADVTALRAARDFLLRTRHQLHFSRGRKEDRLTFELQQEVASFFGFEQVHDVLPVEQFMRRYYVAARTLRRAADALVARCEEAGRPLASAQDRREGPFRMSNGKLELAERAEVLREQPQTTLDLFAIADAAGASLHSRLQDEVRTALPALSAAKGSPQVVASLLALLTRPGSRGRFLFDAHELGVLGAVMPEFGRITAHHQHDLYHVYTVDVHSLFATERLYRLRAGDLADEAPELGRECGALADPLPLYLGMLMHDVGKGMGGDHSEKGRVLMAQLGERLGLRARQREIAEFLVAQHLLMSQTAQRRDITDPELVARFAEVCGDVEKLTCLYLLTWADICSVGPNMWNDWKARLLAELFHRARSVLLGAPHEDRPGTLATSRRRFEDQWLRVFGPSRTAELSEALPERYFLTADPAAARLHASLLVRVAKMGLAASVRQRARGGFTELILAAPDRPGLLALFAGVLSAHRIDVLRARIASTKDGTALDVFDVHGPNGALLDRPRWRKARADLRRVLKGETTVDQILKARRPSDQFGRALPKVQTRITVDNRASDEFTVIDVRAEDRVGLLYVIASALKEAGAQIALATIATEGNRAIDSFYVTEGGVKIRDPARVEALTRSVHDAVDAFERSLK